jgi:hypothetical protein
LGTTLNNIHLFVEKSSTATDYDNVISAVKNLMRQQGFHAVTPLEAERSIRVIFMPESPWISIYQMDSHQRLPSMPSLLSKNGNLAIEIELFDSDVLDMRLFRDGETIDAYSDWDNYDEHPRTYTGDPLVWSSVLPTVISAEKLETVWAHQSADAPFESEGALYRVLDMLKIERWRLWLDKTLEDIPETVEVTDLHFRYGQSLPYDMEAVGLPSFRITYYRNVAKATMGRNYDLSLAVMNRGGQSVGIKLDLRGDALDRALIEPIGLITQSPFNSFSGEISFLPEVRKEPDGATVSWFNLDAQHIPAGLADWDALYALPIHLRDHGKEFDLFRNGGAFAVVIKPIKIGIGELFTRVIPIENPDAFAEFTTIFEVTK